MMRLNIGLFGIDGLYNYGCEAIIRGTVEIIRSQIPNCNIIYYSHRAEEDKKKISDLQIEVRQVERNLNIVKRIINKILKILKIKYRIPRDNYKMLYNETDVIISIGGDIYTIPKHLRDNRTYEYYNPLVQFGNYIKRKNKTLIIFGASIGPFGNYLKAKNYYIKHLCKADLIVCRENRTIEYLKNNGIYEKTVFFPDPAFFVTDKWPNVDISEDMHVYIAINLSPLSLKEMFGVVNSIQMKKLAQIICCIAKETRKNIMLIPHVIAPDNNMDNDLVFL